MALASRVRPSESPPAGYNSRRDDRATRGSIRERLALTPLQIVALVERYKRERDRFEKLATVISRRLSARLFAAAIPHVPTFRSKDPDSLHNKLARESDKHEITRFERDFAPCVKDLAGVRVLLYRPRDVEPTCAIIEELFLVPQPAEFRRDHVTSDGYQARHRVACLRMEDVDADPMAANLRWTPCEIQVVTIADHIWNELEHDIVYKTPHGGPTEVQKAWLKTLRDQLNLVGGTVVKLMDATDQQRAEVSAPIESPEDLRRALEARTERRLAGDFDGLLDLLSGVLREVTATELHRLPLSSADLDGAASLLERIGQDAPSERLGLVIGALWPLYGVEFTEIVKAWPGRPGPVSRLVRALDRAAKDGKI